MCAAIGKHGFIHGVGSFDPLPDGVLLWSRLTLPDEALGKPVDVNWAIFEDEACKELVQEYVEDFVVDRQGCRCFGQWSFLTSCNCFDWAQGGRSDRAREGLHHLRRCARTRAAHEVLGGGNLVSSWVDASMVVLGMPILAPQDGGPPSRRYYYRFWYNNYKSCTGITKTTTHGALESLVFGMTSCANWGESALF